MNCGPNDRIKKLKMMIAIPYDVDSVILFDSFRALPIMTKTPIFFLWEIFLLAKTRPTRYYWVTEILGETY